MGSAPAAAGGLCFGLWWLGRRTGAGRRGAACLLVAEAAAVVLTLAAWMLDVEDWVSLLAVSALLVAPQPARPRASRIEIRMRRMRRK
jgi:hypothetical protein